MIPIDIVLRKILDLNKLEAKYCEIRSYGEEREPTAYAMGCILGPLRGLALDTVCGQASEMQDGSVQRIDCGCVDRTDGGVVRVALRDQESTVDGLVQRP